MSSELAVTLLPIKSTDTSGDINSNVGFYKRLQ